MSLAAEEMKKSIGVNCEMLQALSLNKKRRRAGNWETERCVQEEEAETNSEQGRAE